MGAESLRVSCGAFQGWAYAMDTLAPEAQPQSHGRIQLKHGERVLELARWL